MSSMPDIGKYRKSVVAKVIFLPRKFVTKTTNPTQSKEKIKNLVVFDFLISASNFYLDITLRNSSTGPSDLNSPRFFLIFSMTAILAYPNISFNTLAR